MNFHNVNIKHPNGRDRANGAKSTAYMTINRDLKSGKLDEIPMTEDDLVRVIAQASRTLATLKGVHA